MNMHYYCLNCDIMFNEDEIGNDNGVTYCVWCDDEDVMLIGSSRTPDYVIDNNPYSTQLVDHKKCSCEDYPCCGH